MRFLGLAAAILCTAMLAGRMVKAQSATQHVQALLPEVARGSYLGVTLRDIDADRAAALKLPEPEGVEVTHVAPGSPAEKAGIQPGDVLLTYNGENILGAEHLARLVAETPEGRKIKIRYSRNGHEQTTVVTTGAAPSAIPLHPGMPSLPPSEFFNFRLPDMPAPLLIWKTSLGVECEPLEGQLARYFGVSHGVLVRSVDKDSAGEKAGLRAGDVLTMFGDHSVSSPKDVTAFLRVHEPGKPIPVMIMREHREMRLTIVESSAR